MDKELYVVIECTVKVKEIMKLNLMNKQTGESYSNASVLEENTIEQILKEYAADIGVDPQRHNLLFSNNRTGHETSNRKAAVRDLDLKDGDVLVILQDNACQDDPEGIIKIDLVNRLNGKFYLNVRLYPENSMAQILTEFAKELGIDPRKNILFLNKRTGKETEDRSVAAGELGLETGDVLVICEDVYA